MAKAATQTKAKDSNKAPPGPAAKMPEVASGNAKNALAALEAGKGSPTHMIAPDKLRIIPGFNVRIHETTSYATELDDLKNSIISEGFYQSKPLTGFVGKEGDEDVIFVTDGHRRLEAVRAALADGAEIPALPVVLRDSKTSMVDLNVALIKENTGRRLTFYENAIVVNRLLKGGLKDEEISDRLNFTKRAVDDFILLITAPRSIRNAVREDKISGSEAVRIIRKHANLNDKGKKAEAVVQKMLDKAAKRGADKATRKDSGDAPVRAKTRGKSETATEDGDEEVTSKVRMTTFETNWNISAGQSFDLKEVRYFKNLFGDSDWFVPDEQKAGWATATEDVQFKAVIRRPKKDDAPAAKEEESDESEESEGSETDETEAEADETTGEL